MEFKIIEHDDADDMTAAVNNFLAAGWELWGVPVIANITYPYTPQLIWDGHIFVPQASQVLTKIKYIQTMTKK